MGGVLDDETRLALEEVRADMLLYGKGVMRGGEHVPLAPLAKLSGLNLSRLAVEHAIAPIIAQMPAITYRGFLRQSVAPAALVAGLTRRNGGRA